MDKLEKLERAEKLIREAVIYLEQYSDESNYVDLGQLVKYMDDCVFFLNGEIKNIPLTNIDCKPLLPR